MYSNLTNISHLSPRRVNLVLAFFIIPCNDVRMRFVIASCMNVRFFFCVFFFFLGGGSSCVSVRSKPDACILHI